MKELLQEALRYSRQQKDFIHEWPSRNTSSDGKGCLVVHLFGNAERPYVNERLKFYQLFSDSPIPAFFGYSPLLSFIAKAGPEKFIQFLEREIAKLEEHESIPTNRTTETSGTNQEVEVKTPEFATA